MKTRPILHPPIQVSHLYYRLTRVLVWGGTGECVCDGVLV